MPSRRRRSANDSLRAGGKPEGSIEHVQRQLESLGLNGYEARVLVALLQAGSAGASELAGASGVDRTNVYPVMTALVEKALAFPLGGKVARWSTAGPDEVLGRLYAGAEERLRELEAGMEEARQSLSRIATGPETAPPPHIHFIRGTSQAHASYEQLLARAERELVMFTRPPYARVPGKPQPAVLETLERGVAVRVLYAAAQLEGPGTEGLMAEVDVYHRAGVQARFVDHLPVKLVVADGAVALVAMPDPTAADGGYPTNVLIEHRGYAQMHALAFEQAWAQARPYEDLRTAAPGTGRGRDRSATGRRS